MVKLQGKQFYNDIFESTSDAFMKNLYKCLSNILQTSRLRSPTPVIQDFYCLKNDKNTK